MHVVDGMREIVAVGIVLEVRDEIVELGLGRLEGPSWRDVDAPDDLVDSHKTCNVAALRRLIPYVFGPVFLDALFGPLSESAHGGNERSAPAQSSWGYRNSNPSGHMTRGRNRTNYSTRPRGVLRHSTSRSIRMCVARSACLCRCEARRPAILGRPLLLL